MKLPTGIIVCVFFLICTESNGQSTVILDSLPELGEIAPCLPVPFLPGIDDYPTSGVCRVNSQGVSFLMSTINCRVWGYSTRDTAFISPEGIRMGQTIKEIRVAGGTEINREVKHGFVSQLPSGWWVSFEGKTEYLNDRIDSQYIVMKSDSLIFQFYRTQ